MFNKKSFIAIIVGFFLMGNIGYAWPPHPGHHRAHSFVAGAIVGAALTRKNNRPRGRYVARQATPVMTSEIKIQRALTSLGFYHGRIDGEINSYETRTAIKEMNIAYNISQTGSLRAEDRDTLIYLGDLFGFDRMLISQENTKRAKGRKIQTALKIQGFYHDRIDGMIGPGTRRNISEYKEAKGLSYSAGLDFEEEYQLFDSSQKLNNQNIDDAIATLKSNIIPPKQERLERKDIAENNITDVRDTQREQAN